LVRDSVLCKVKDLDEPESLFGTIESQADAVGRECEDYGFGDRFCCGIGEVEFRESLRFGLEPRQDIVKGCAQYYENNRQFLLG
jgi:hypothetical protein